MVSASGLNILPSSDSRVNSGTKTIMMMRMAKTTGRETSRTASKVISVRERWESPLSRMWREIFSVTTIAPSTTMPMAMARPPRLIRFAVTPCQPISRNATAAVRGSETATVSAARRSHSTRKSTATTRRTPCPSAVETVSMQAWIRSVRS